MSAEDVLSDSLEWDAPIVSQDTAEHSKAQPAFHLRDDAEKELAGDMADVHFQLPNGSTDATKFYMGQTIESMKAYLEDAFGLAYETTVLYLGEVLLMDPLCLVDVPFNPKAVNVVRVTLTTA